jgi:hypothetical protein
MANLNTPTTQFRVTSVVLIQVTESSALVPSQLPLWQTVALQSAASTEVLVPPVAGRQAMWPVSGRYIGMFLSRISVSLLQT